ncbi:Outer membrane protein OmpA [Georgenia satyanarayanai]|uniref:Outer membrane protein OmpA n=1 Tax=Georgenia satyanarayanai TaxID=860221 RepID=A0A2Y8ZXL7_9MICO|nr:OmpA family protein [Georgenia satyanarayanai]PYG01922.1 outer membrane protein OmpA-like peptidoglycan-associated protein [Georgenia satyanarayanai]SSA36725.1 Outer membrane protein OmpA [Georgenia satyanarayanai]
MRSSRVSVSVLATGALLLAGCSGEAEPAASPAEPTPSATGSTVEEKRSPTEESKGATATAPVGQRFSQCEPGEGKTVTMLEDEVIEAQEVPEVVVEAFELGGETVPAQVIEAVTIPERVIDRGCIVEYDAPGGCLGAVEISGALIPGYSLPSRVLPAVMLPDGTVLEEIVVDGVTQPDVVVDGVSAEQVCQVEDDEPGSYVSAVYRPAIYRAAGYQPASYQSVAYRPVEYLDDGQVPGASIPGVSVPGSSVSGESVSGASLEGYRLEGTDDVEVTDKDESVSYSSEGDVLFGNNEDEILPEATSALEAVVADIADRGTPAAVVVEGHTDDVGTEEHNLDLSERRAQAVATWLVDHGGLDAGLVSTTGHGFAHPRADNDTDEGRAQNRRVVITIKFE